MGRWHSLTRARCEPRGRWGKVVICPRPISPEPRVRFRHVLALTKSQSYPSWMSPAAGPLTVGQRGSYCSSMKVKTSITLSEDVLEQLDSVPGSESRSALIERILRAFLRRRALDAEQTRDRALLDRDVDVFNSEALDVLEYQVAWSDADE